MMRGTRVESERGEFSMMRAEREGLCAAVAMATEDPMLCPYS